MISRRNLLLGAPTVVAAASLMPVRSIMRLDPLVYGISYQTWPFETPRPEFHMCGACVGDDQKVLSHFLPYATRHRDPIYWKPVWLPNAMPPREPRERIYEYYNMRAS